MLWKRRAGLLENPLSERWSWRSAVVTARMSTQAENRQQSRILFVKNLNYGVQGECRAQSATVYATTADIDAVSFCLFSFRRAPGSDLYELFGRYGAIRQVRIGDQPGKTKGTAFVVYEEMGDAKNALEHLNGFHLQERYIVGACTWMQRQLL